VEGQLLAPEEAVHDLKAFLHPDLALGVAGEREAQGALIERFPGADAEHETAIAQAVGGRGHLGDERRVVVKQRAGHSGAELYILRCGRDGAKPRPDKASGARVVDPRVEVVAAEHGVEPGLLGGHGLLDQVFGLVGLVAAQPGELHHASISLIAQSCRVTHDLLTGRDGRRWPAGDST
jgi:hypothetical protein